MSLLKESVKEITSMRLTNVGIKIPTDIDSYVDEVEFAILNYCNLDQVPLELKFVWISMLLDYFKWLDRQTASAGNGSQKEDAAPTVLTSIKEGDTTLGFSADTSSQAYKALNAHKLTDVLDKIVLNYVDQLNRFRRVVW